MPGSLTGQQFPCLSPVLSWELPRAGAISPTVYDPETVLGAGSEEGFTKSCPIGTKGLEWGVGTPSSRITEHVYYQSTGPSEPSFLGHQCVHTAKWDMQVYKTARQR